MNRTSSKTRTVYCRIGGRDVLIATTVLSQGRKTSQIPPSHLIYMTLLEGTLDLGVWGWESPHVPRKPPNPLVTQTVNSVENCQIRAFLDLTLQYSTCIMCRYSKATTGAHTLTVVDSDAFPSFTAAASSKPVKVLVMEPISKMEFSLGSCTSDPAWCCMETEEPFK